jgi:hypothetical protein
MAGQSGLDLEKYMNVFDSCSYPRLGVHPPTQQGTALTLNLKTPIKMNHDPLLHPSPASMARLTDDSCTYDHCLIPGLGYTPLAHELGEAHYYYTVVTLLLHCCYTVVTQLLHYC